MTLPSNFTLTSPPRLTFPEITFKYTNQGVPLGFTFDNGGKDDMTSMIFDSLKLDNVFTLSAPWSLSFAFPFGFIGVQAIGYETTYAAEWNIVAAAHNSVVRCSFPFCSFFKSKTTM
jgi:hypothetical protein